MEIFAIKVECYQKSRRNLEVFLALPNFRGLTFEKWYPHYHLSLAARGLEKFREGNPTNRDCVVQLTSNSGRVRGRHHIRPIRQQYSVSQKIHPPEDLWQYFQNGWEFFNQILHAYCAFLSTLECKFLFNYLQI